MGVPLLRLFDPNDRRWFCFCGCMHVKTGTSIIAVLAIIFGIISVFGVILIVPFAALMLYGIKREQPGLFVPFMFLTIIKLIIFFALFLYGLVVIGQTVNQKQSNDHSSNDKNLWKSVRHSLITDGVVEIAIGMIGFFLQIFCLSVTWRAYQYISEKNKACEEADVDFPVVVGVIQRLEPKNPGTAPFYPEYPINPDF